MTEDKPRRGRPLLEVVRAPWPDLFKYEKGRAGLADRLGVSQTTVGKWARGVHRIPVLARKVLIEICEEHAIREGISNLK